MTQQLEMFNYQATPAQVAPSSINLRDYQEECLVSIATLQSEGDNRLIAQLATGLGKTVIFSAQTMRTNAPTLILAHRDELLTQAIAKLRLVWPEADIGRVQANANETGHQITVSSVQTLYREKRFKEAFPDPAWLKLVITDEAHHVFAPSYKMIYERLGLMERNPLAPLHLGVTATPIRGDKASLGEVFDRFAYKMGIKEGIARGYLCDLAGYVLTLSNENMADVHIKGGDYDQDELAEAVVNVARTEAIVNCWLDKAKLETQEGTSYRQTVVFCVNILHAQQVAETFSASGIRADVVYDGLDKAKRRQILADFEDGKITVLCNCMILAEGWDCPETSCVVMARPTKNKSLYIQCVGRGTRPFPQGGKRNCLIIDVADISSKVSVHYRAETLDKALELRQTNAPLNQEDALLKEVQSVLDLLEEKLPGEGKTIKGKNAKEGSVFDPFADPTEGRANKLSWATGATGLTLPLPKKVENSRHYLVVKRRRDYLWDVVHIRQERVENTGGFPQWKTTGEKFVNEFGLPDQVSALSKAERYAKDICPEVGKLRAKDASWKTTEAPASLAQLQLLQKKKLPITINGKPVTKVEASAMLDATFTKSIKAKLDRTIDELEIY
jgi:superfamily II DNA or RNA helicase